MTNKELDKILEKSECVQKEMHSMIKEIRKTKRGKNIPYEDLVTVFFFLKFAELENKIENQIFAIKN